MADGEAVGMTPITDRARIKSAGFGFEPYVSIETASALEQIAGELYERLNNARDDVNEAINTHINNYGENYPSKNARLAAMREELAKVDAALAKFQAMKDEATK